MKKTTVALATLVAAGFAIGGVQAASVSVGTTSGNGTSVSTSSGGSSGSTGETRWWQSMDLDGQNYIVVVDKEGKAQRINCEPGQTVSVSGGQVAATNTSGTDASASGGLSGSTSVGGLSTSVNVGNGQASGGTTMPGNSGTSVTTGTSTGGNSRVTITCQ